MPHTPDDFTELIDADIDRVDLVDKAANGTTFLIAKRADGASSGLIPPDLVRDLIGKTAEPAPVTDAVTMSGSPAAIARLIHEAAVRKEPAPVTKDADMAPETDLDPTVVLAEPTESGEGNAATPGSPAWEAIDAATARKWTAILSRAKTALLVMEGREVMEDASGELGAYDAALDLSNAAYAIDYAISVLAPFAVNEQAEVDSGAMEAVGKALAGFDAVPLEVIESLEQVRKAGRSLSAANERAIRDAVESLQKVLSSLPAAPDTPDGGQPVAKKENPMPDNGIETTPVAPATEAAVEPVTKADDGGKAPMVAVYDAKGKLVGIVNPDEITPISGADAAEEETAQAASAADLEAAPAAEVGVPAHDEDVAKEAAADTTDTDVTKTAEATPAAPAADITEVIKGLLDQHGAAQNAAILELAERVETLKGRLTAVEEQPAVPGIFSNGQTPGQGAPAHLLRGQDQGAAGAIDLVKARELKTALTSGTPLEQNAAHHELQTDAIAQLARIHASRPQ